MQQKRLVSTFFFILLLFLSLPCMAHDAAIVDKEIYVIDSLIEYIQLDLAQKKADSLYLLLKSIGGNSYNQLEQVLKVRLQQGEIFDDKAEHKKALPLFLEVLKQAEKNKFYHLACYAYIRTSLNQEKTGNYDIAYSYLKDALKLCRKYHLEDLYSTILVRTSSLHRMINRNNPTPEQKRHLSEMGFEASIDTAIDYAKKAIIYAQKYNKKKDLNDTYLLLGMCTHLKMDNKQNSKNIAISYYLKTIPYLKKTNDYESLALIYSNISAYYLRIGNAKTALLYNDSSYIFYDKISSYYKHILPKRRAKIFEALHNIDSAYYYMQISYSAEYEMNKKQEAIYAKQLEEQYQNDKKEITIKNKNNQIAFVFSLLLLIVLAYLLLIHKNNQIATQNKIINQQVLDLEIMLTQKQTLLSELQHRVKNNLQHVISILDIQKESASFNNIEELIRSSQNRIYSMALLHKKLNVSDSINSVNLEKYLTELSELVKKSYNDEKKIIELQLRCEVEYIPIAKILPIGLILVELLSNSMKHAFIKQNTGLIRIELTKDEANEKNKFYYADNGIGFDFSANPQKGIGIEIVKGFIDQLGATIHTQQHEGSELIITFK